jgi:uncharacterized protein YutE (UPF0331/DUF86 family)
MPSEFTGIERRLDELSERLARLRPLQAKSRDDFARDVYLRDIVERNLEVAAQCCIDLSHRIIAIEQAAKPRDYHEAILRMGELGVTPVSFARQLAPIAGFRNILIHEYLSVDWDEVFDHLQHLDDLERFADFVRGWLTARPAIQETLEQESDVGGIPARADA